MILTNKKPGDAYVTRLVARENKKDATKVRTWTPQIRAALNKQIEKVASEYKRGMTVDDVQTFISEDEEFKAAYSNFFEKVCIQFATEADSQLVNKYKSLTFLPRLIAAVLFHTLTNLTNVSTSTATLIINEMSIGAANGDGVLEIADRIAALKTLSRMRALRIVRTELTAARSIASKYAVENISEDLDIQLLKYWAAQNNSRTRQAHRNAISHPPIDTSKKFTVGGELLEYPGDPRGSARNVVNCRCALGHFATEDIDLFRG